MSHEDERPALDKIDSVNYYRGVSTEKSILTEHFMAYSAESSQSSWRDAEKGQEVLQNDLQSK